MYFKVAVLKVSTRARRRTGRDSTEGMKTSVVVLICVVTTTGWLIRHLLALIAGEADTHSLLRTKSAQAWCNALEWVWIAVIAGMNSPSIRERNTPTGG